MAIANPRTYQVINTQTHQLKKLKSYFLFYIIVPFFTPF